MKYTKNETRIEKLERLIKQCAEAGDYENERYYKWELKLEKEKEV